MGAKPGEKVFYYFQLMRLPNVFTAIADVLAGYLIVAQAHIRPAELSLLLLSSAGIYAAGCVLNDLCDKDVDAQERPSRPIPSGAVSPREAFALTCLLFTAGLFAAFKAGPHSFYTAAVLVALVIAYDALAKKRKLIGPLTMGACRAVNLLLGMTPVMPSVNIFFFLPLVSLYYVFSLTRLSRSEVCGGRQSVPALFGGWLAVIVSVLLLRYGGLMTDDSMIFLGLYAALTAPLLLKGYFTTAPETIKGAVKILILGIPLIDAAYVSGVRGWTYGIPVALCLVPAVILSKYFHVT